MTRSRRRTIIVAAGFATLAGGAAIYFQRTSALDATSDSASAILAAADADAASNLGVDVAIPVAAEPARLGTLVVRVSASGQAEPVRRTVVTAQIPGRIREIAVGENSTVAADRPLLVIDPVEYQLQVDAANATLRTAEATYREMTLFDDQIEDPATRQERESFARARSGLESAEIALRRAELELARTRVSAPIGGRIADLRVVPGEWVQPGTELMTVAALDPIRVQVRVLESEVGHLTTGGRAEMSFAAFPGERFEGRVQSINPLVESDTRTARVTVVAPNPGGRILPGMYARVGLDAHAYEDRVMIPRSAVLERDRREMVFVYEEAEGGGRAKWRYITTGVANETHVEVVEDPTTDIVRDGEMVLTDGHFSLVHDARVRLAEAVGPPEG